MRKFLIILLSISILTSLIGCGCEHEWSEVGNCLDGYACIKCGEIGNYNDCTFTEPTCTTPETCIKCGLTFGEAIGHDYIDGYCSRCGSEDPDYIKLSQFGFLKNYGMNAWLRIYGYDFAENKVLVHTYSTGPQFKFRIFYNSYFIEGYATEEAVKNNDKITNSTLENISTTPCDFLSNDVIQFNNGQGIAPATIIDRIVDSNNKKLIIKVLDETYMSDDEEWYVPSDLLDFSTAVNDNSYGERSFVKIEFK